jgi:hypothetical protein
LKNFAGTRDTRYLRVAVVGFDALEDDAGRLVSSESDEFSCGFRDTRWLQAAAVAVRSKHDSRKVMSYSCGLRDTRQLQAAVVFLLMSRPPESDRF